MTFVEKEKKAHGQQENWKWSVERFSALQVTETWVSQTYRYIRR